MMRARTCFGFLGLLLATAPTIFAQEWESNVTPYAPGSFSEPKAVHLHYNFGWANVVAATAELHLSKADNRYRLEATGATTGAARALWKFDGKQTALTDTRTLLPLQVHETEASRNKTSETEINFTPAGATSRRDEHRGAAVKSKTRDFEFPHLMSMSSALLYLRSQSLADGTVQRIVVYPATTAYLCSVRVLGRERLTVPSGGYDAIKLELQLNKIDKDRTLKPHKKFKRATVWLSDDNDRLVLRIEAQIFIGTVFAELQTVQFDK